MVKKWVCQQCTSEFSRRWNMERHIKLVHSRSSTDIPRTRFIGRIGNYRLGPPQSVHASPDPYLFPSSEEWPFRGFSQISEAMKMMTEYNNSVAKAQPLSLPNVEYLQREINSRTAEISNIYSNYWLIHKSTIKGISGFYCRRCQSFGFDYVKNLGYDMTFEARHVCNEMKVKSIQAVSIRKRDIDSTDNFFGQVLSERANFFIPGKKYLIGKDFSNEFEWYSSVTSYNTAMGLMGIPDRFSLFRLNNPEILPWINRVLMNLDKKTELQESEVIDFLGRVKSSYAMFEIPTSNLPKVIFLALAS